MPSSPFDALLILKSQIKWLSYPGSVVHNLSPLIAVFLSFNHPHIAKYGISDELKWHWKLTLVCSFTPIAFTGPLISLGHSITSMKLK